MINLHGKRIWVSGASSGIGRALAIELARRGAIPILTARREDELREAVNEIESGGGKGYWYPGDVKDLARMKEISASIEQEIGPVDIIIANAGSHTFSNPLEFNSKQYLDIVDLNFGGMLRMIEAGVPTMLSRGRGLVVGVASVAGYRGLPRAAAYVASKAAMIHFLESIRFHLRLKGVQVAIVNPGFVRTPLTDKNDFPMPFLIEVDEAARAICDGLEKGKKEIVFPFPFSWIMKFLRILPYPLYDWLLDKVWQTKRPD